MDHTKTCKIRWKDITTDNFTTYLHQTHNGFAILTGGKYFVIDLDLKYNPPEHIFTILMEGCHAVEKTPGGYHFWFLTDARTSHFNNGTDIYWNNVLIKGLDRRGTGGICYTAPSHYEGTDSVVRHYSWQKGNLSTAKTITPTLLEHLTHSIIPDDTTSFTITKDNQSVAQLTDEIITVLQGLSQTRVDNYTQWIQVGMALKNSGQSCEIWDEWSRSSSKYKSGICHEKWDTFSEKDRPLTKNSLYAWLKEDNYQLFIALQGCKNHIQNSLFIGTNANIADAFYEMNHQRYLFSTVDGWFILQDNHTWVSTGSTDVMSIPTLLNTIYVECKHVICDILMKCNHKNEDEKMLSKQLGETLKKISTSSFVKGVAAFLPGLYCKSQVEKLFNERRELFAFTNGVIDMGTHTFRHIDPEDYITVTCGYDYRISTQEEKDMVRSFLSKIFPSEAVLNYVLLALSRCLQGTNTDQVFHVFTGMGANGKSCLMDLCKIVFGDYYQTFSVSYLTKESDGKDKPLPEFAAARYARMLVTSEPDERDKFQINMIKNITGNEEVSFRGMYAKTVTKYVPQFKLWILTNDMPRLSKYDQAIERRMRCVHFPTRFVYSPRAENEELRDDTLSYQFKTDERWKYGLLGLLLDAAFINSNTKLDMPIDVREFTDAYMLENNPVGAWLRAYYDITGRRDDVIQKTEFYQSFLTDTGIHKTQKSFSEDIVKCNVGEKKVMGERYYFGVVRKVTLGINQSKN